MDYSEDSPDVLPSSFYNRILGNFLKRVTDQDIFRIVIIIISIANAMIVIIISRSLLFLEIVYMRIGMIPRVGASVTRKRSTSPSFSTNWTYLIFK